MRVQQTEDVKARQRFGFDLAAEEYGKERARTGTHPGEKKSYRKVEVFECIPC